VHCRLVAIEGGAIVMDEGSTNGTWVNDAPVVQPTVVTVNDELRIGPFLVRVQSLVGGDSTASPRVPMARARPAAPVEVSEALASAERPRVNESPTDLRVPQALVFWRILGFQQPASLEEAGAAYASLVEQYAPDTVAQLSPEQRAAAELRLRELEFAWDYLQRLFQRAAQQNKEAAA
jgi:pSer/pThr/pTyr-binding forkhead associated (FHA) protein